MNSIDLSINIPSLVLISITLLAIGVCLFLIGYLAGTRAIAGVSNTREKEPISFFKQQQQQNNIPKTIQMDSSKYVVDIKTEGLEKKYESLGEIKESQENISESINRLKNLKR